MADTIIVSLAGTTSVWLGLRVARSHTGPRLADRLSTIPRPEPLKANPSSSVLVWMGTAAILYLTSINLRTGAGSTLDFGYALANPSQAYGERQSALALATGSGAASAVIHLATVFVFVMPAVLTLRWRQLGPVVKWVGLATATIYAVSWLVMGTLKGFIETAVLFAVCVALVRARRTGVTKQRRRPAIVVIILVACAGIVAIAANTLGGRLMQGPGDQEPPIYLRSILGQQGAVGLQGFVGYFAQGHSGLGASLSQPFVWTEGSGSSEGLQALAPWLANAQDNKLAYPYRAQVQQGWPAKAKWQTVYPWLASDFTFAGAILVVGLFAYAAGVAWVVAVRRGGVFATALFAQLFLFLTYIPLNNSQINSTSNLVAALVLCSCAAAYRIDFERRRALLPLTHQALSAPDGRVKGGGAG